MAWLIALAVIGVAFSALIYDYRRKQARNVEEYEAELEKQGISGQMMRGGLLELQKMLNPDTKAAVEFAKDEQQGQTKTAKGNEEP
ncbi:MAG: hypothetical protein K1Y36_28130 [Blastocatellia bacterium]|nr:hypothetical protein [Blastocatellia bacterium]